MAQMSQDTCDKAQSKKLPLGQKLPIGKKISHWARKLGIWLLGIYKIIIDRHVKGS